MITVV